MRRFVFASCLAVAVAVGVAGSTTSPAALGALTKSSTAHAAQVRADSGSCSDMRFNPLGKCGAVVRGPGTLSTHLCFHGKAFCTAPFKLSAAVSGYGACDARVGHQTESGKCLTVDQVTFKGGVGLAIQTPDSHFWCTDVDPCAESVSQAYTLAWPVAGNTKPFDVTISIVGFGWVASHISWEKEIHFGADTEIPVRPSGAPPPSPKTALDVALSAPIPSSGLGIGASADVTAKVTAVGGSVSSISLGKGLVSSSDLAVVTAQPSGLSGFSLARGASRSFVFKLKGAKTGTAGLSLDATGKSASGRGVRGSGSLKVNVGGKELLVLMDVSPAKPVLETVPKLTDDKGGVPVTVTVRVKNVSAAKVDHVTVDPKLLFAYDDGLPPGSIMPLRQNGKPSAAGDLGSLASGATTKPVTFKLLARGDGGYSIEALATAAQAGAARTLRAIGTGRIDATSPLLSYETKIDPKVNGAGTLDAAGVPYTINVEMQNLSYRKSVAFFPIFSFEGNAQGGQLIPVDAEIPDPDSKDLTSVCAPPPAVQLKPRESMTLKLVVQTSRAAAATLGAKGGGTRSVVNVHLPIGWIVNKDGTGTDGKLTRGQIVMSDPTRYEVHLSDPGLIAYPPSDYPVAEGGLYIAKGLLTGLGAFEYGILHGLFVDLPTAVTSAYLAKVQFDADLYQNLKANDAASLDGTLFNPVTKSLLFVLSKAPALAEFASEIPGQVRTSVDKYFTSVMNDYYAGDWRKSLEVVSASASETTLNIATLIPSLARDVGACILPRAEDAIRSLARTKTALFDAAATKLAALPETLPATEAIVKAAQIPDGMALDYSVIQRVFGYTKKQIDYLRNFVRNNPTGKKLLLTLRSRAPQAIDWLQGQIAYGKKWAAALLKPEQFKIKSVSFLDTEAEGYNIEDLGRVVLRRPQSTAEVQASLKARGIPSTVIDPTTGREAINPTWADAFKLNKLRIDEYLHARGGFTSGSGGYYKDVLDAAKQGKMTLRWNLEDNSFGPGFKNGYDTYPFRLAKTNGHPVPVSEIPTYKGDMIPEFFVNGEWRCITGDADFLTMTTAESTPLDASDRFVANNALSTGELGMLHPPADTWTQNGSFWFAAKENEFKRAGKVLQIAPDGNVYAVTYDPATSYWEDAEHYRAGFKSGYLGPIQRPGG